MPSRLLTLTVLVMCLAYAPAHARCESAVALATLHDAYRATLTDHGPRQRQAAMTLLFLTGERDPATIARQVRFDGPEVSEDQLATILANAQTLATQVLQGTVIKDEDFRHGSNVRWLEATYRRAGCEVSVRANASQNNTPSFGVSDPPPRRPPPVDNTGVSASLLQVAAIVLAALLVGYGSYLLYKSPKMQQQRVERMPRTPISLALDATFTDEQGNLKQARVEALDVSIGGMKLNWPTPPPLGAIVTLTLLDSQRTSQIAWSNKFAAGVIFKTRLTKEEHAALKALGTA